MVETDDVFSPFLPRFRCLSPCLLHKFVSSPSHHNYHQTVDINTHMTVVVFDRNVLSLVNLVVQLIFSDGVDVIIITISMHSHCLIIC